MILVTSLCPDKTQKVLEDVTELFRVAAAVERLSLFPADDPVHIRMRDVDALKAALGVRGLIEIDGHRPAGIVEGIDLDSPSVLPQSVTTGGVPGLQADKSVCHPPSLPHSLRMIKDIIMRKSESLFFSR
jgi:hypothetical protein